MTEREAKGLATEVEHHRYWRVVDVYQTRAGEWHILLEHRVHPNQQALIQSLCWPDVLAILLVNHGALIAGLPPSASQFARVWRFE